MDFGLPINERSNKGHVASRGLSCRLMRELEIEFQSKISLPTPQAFNLNSIASVYKLAKFFLVSVDDFST